MEANYLWLEFLHIFIAVVALGTSAGLGIVFEFYGNDPTHGPFVLRVIERMLALIVLPGYVLMLATGLWMANSAWSSSPLWIRFALGLWVVGIVCLGCSLAVVRRQSRSHRASRAHFRYAVAGRALGAAFGLVVVAILYLMVFKP